MTDEMGKTLDDGRAEVEKCAFHCDWFADHAAEYLAGEQADIGGGEAFVTFNPLGVVLAIMPWNFPFWQVFRAVAPALMAGNGMLLKHASNVPGCALAIEEVLHQAGVPHSLFRALLLPTKHVEALIKDQHIAAVTLTGSVAAGRAVASEAGAVLKKCVLELGGSDAYVVLEDADVHAAAKIAAKARMVNGGQSCIAGKRFIVVREIKEQFEAALVDAMRGFVMGDPTQRSQPVRSDESASRRAMKSTTKSGKASRRARGCCSAARSPIAPAPGTPPPSSPTCGPASRRTTRKSLAPSRRSSPPTTRPTPFASPTIANSVSARGC